jgi:ribonucleoside-triphosphate reductase
MLSTTYQQFIHLSRYARWIDEKSRRETWSETVDRYIDFMCGKQCAGKIPDDTRKELREAILSLEVMPSMRCMMTAGQALERSNCAGFNCSALIINRPHAFDELFYLLLNGCGVGFSVERQFIAEMPTVAEKFKQSNSVIVVEDSKEGWATALRELIGDLYSGIIPKWDTSKVRPAGSRLKVFGGRASGPEALVSMFRFVVEVFKGAAGRKLNSLECHDICTREAESVVVGGVRRCLEENTLVLMNDETWKRISDVMVGDFVKLGEDDIGVTAVFDNGVKELMRVELESGSFLCTPEHRWYVYDHKEQKLVWVETKELGNGEYSFVEPTD